MNLTLTTPPTTEVVTLIEAKAHCRVVGTTDDDYITGLIVAARQKWELETKYHLSEAEYQLTLASCDRHSNKIVLPLRPVIEVEAVSELVVDTDYTVVIDVETGRATITLFTTVDDDIVIVFKVGFPDPEPDDSSPPVTPPSSAPTLAKHALKCLVAHWYNCRESYQEGYDMKTVPATFQSIVTNFRIA